MNSTINLKLNDYSKLEMILPCEEKELHCCIDVLIFLEIKDHKYLLHDSDSRYALDCLEGLFTQNIKGVSKLYESIKDDIGYLWNEELQGKGDLPVDENTKLWVGRRQLLFHSKELATWLYNENNEIYLKVTPVYKWDNDGDSLMDADYISYDEFIKNYKPILTIKVDKKCAEQILKKTLELQSIIDSNLQKMHTN